MRLDYSKQNKTSSKKEIAEDAFFGALLGAGIFSCICTAFQLSWTPANAFAGSPLKGLLSVSNIIADHVGERDYIILKRFAGGVLGDGSPVEQGLFLTIILVTLMVMGWMILRSRVKSLLLIPIIPMAAIMMLTRTAPAVWAGLMMIFALVCAVSVMRGQNDRIWTPVIPLLALLLTMGIGGVLYDGYSIDASEMHFGPAKNIQRWSEKRFGADPLGSGQLSELEGERLLKQRGSMIDPEESLKDKALTKTALEIKMKDPQPTYLRGFVGETYSKGQWKQLDNATHYKQREQLYWLNREGFDGLSQLATASAAAGDESGMSMTNEIEIEVKGADSSRIYTPYEISGTDSEIPRGTQNYSGAFLKSNRILGTGGYSWTLIPNLTDRWTDLAGKLYSAEETDELTGYFERESRYNVWCYRQYTEIPTEMLGLIEAAMGAPEDLSRHHKDYKEAIESVRTYLDGNFVYSDSFAKPENGKDALEEFLVTGKGCDAHYAGLASLLFRWYGIPARYVEGYLVTPSDTEGAKATQSIRIGTSHAHAWTEIYIDGLGWVPLEVTTAYRNVMPEADMDIGLEAVSYASRQVKRQEMQTEEDTVKSGATNRGHALIRILIATLWILVLILIIWLLRKVMSRQIALRRRRKAFADPDPRRGICAMYGYLLEEKIPRSQLATEIGDMAAFSNNVIDERLRSYMRREMEWGENEKKLLEENDRRNIADRLLDLWYSLRRK